ncbi:uncharacterized protein LOC106638822 [Copidosoma floridanum]|uniref:uncharacterized protein LOC106638822 n=1 Tax=Copidosoma floridanum TaxID=29053 RepID=UPI0006C9CE99|nr:uncharacterized protein LOC106638822 [Copidosoma floridanum]
MFEVDDWNMNEQDSIMELNYSVHNEVVQHDRQNERIEVKNTLDQESKNEDTFSTHRQDMVLDIFRNKDFMHTNTKISLNLDNNSVQKLSNDSNEFFPDSCNKTEVNIKITKPIFRSAYKIRENNVGIVDHFPCKKSVVFAEPVEPTVLKELLVRENRPILKKNSKHAHNSNFTCMNNTHMSQLPIQKSKKSISLKKNVVRMFPGPAGLLVDTKLIQAPVVDVDKRENKNKKHSNVCSQNTENLFTTGAWQIMMDDFPPYFELQDIATVQENASELSKKFKKVPYLAGLIHTIDYKPNNPHIVLKDISGKINACIHHSVCKNYPNALGTNVVLLIKDVSLIVTSKKFVCIIITMKNLVSIYSEDCRLAETQNLKLLLSSKFNSDVPLPKVTLVNKNNRGISEVSSPSVRHTDIKSKLCLKRNNMKSLRKVSSYKNSSNYLNNSDINDSNDFPNSKKHNQTVDLQNVFQDDSLFEVDIVDLNFFTTNQFPSSTPTIINKRNLCKYFKNKGKQK